MDKKNLTMNTVQELRLIQLLEDHLHYNHYPPIIYEMIQPCKEAILSVLSDKPEKFIKVGWLYKPAYEIIDDLHLDWFIDNIESVLEQ